MKRFSIFALLLIITTAVNVKAQEDPEAAEMQKRWMEYMTPGHMHSDMAKKAGEWKAQIKFWLMPGAEAQFSEGTSTNEMIMGGRYLMSKHTGTVFGGMEMEGLSLEGFDNETKEFTAVWIDNMGTGTMVLKGKWNAKTNSISYKGEMVDPMDGIVKTVKEKVTMIDKNHHKMEMWVESDGQMFKSMEIDFLRIVK